VNPLGLSEASRLLTANLAVREVIGEAMRKCWADPNKQQEYRLLLGAADSLDTHRALVLLLDDQASQCVRALDRAGLMDEVRAEVKSLKP
jgi:hypothetical protein